MPRESIPEDLRRFILTSVPSVPFVEALLVFRDAQGREIETAAVARRLYMGERAVAEVVAQLAAAGMVKAGEGPSTHRYAPEPGLAAMLERLAQYYRTHLVEVTDLIHSKTGRLAQQFADAFKWKKEP
jgi:Mn-dependent DtxR family transcriptional regulator